MGRALSRPADADLRHDRAVGHPLANPLHGRRDNRPSGGRRLAFQVRVVDEDGRDVPTARSASCSCGHAGCEPDEGLLPRSGRHGGDFRDGWLWTGDNVRRRDDGFFEFVDRAKDMIKRAGENVAASEVEAVLKDHPAVFDAAVIGVPDPVRDEAIKATSYCAGGRAADCRELIAWCAARLARFRCPSWSSFVAELPRTSVGKIQKHLLRAEFGPEDGTSRTSSAVLKAERLGASGFAARACSPCRRHE